MVADLLPLDGQREVDWALSGWGVAAREMEVLLEDGGFDMDRGVEMTMTQVHIDIQNCD
jgi:hypothetical protein